MKDLWLGITPVKVPQKPRPSTGSHAPEKCPIETHVKKKCSNRSETSSRVTKSTIANNYIGLRFSLKCPEGGAMAKKNFVSGLKARFFFLRSVMTSPTPPNSTTLKILV